MSRLRHPIVVAAAAVVGVVALVVAVTAFTGLPGPGPLRRYRAAELRQLVDAVHEQAGVLRTPDDCWRTLEPDHPSGPDRPVATVDWIRSRVVVGVRADNIGRVDPRTRRAVREELDEVFADHPDLSEDMVVLEPTPQGWSPLMSCSLVVRGWSPT